MSGATRQPLPTQGGSAAIATATDVQGSFTDYTAPVWNATASKFKPVQLDIVADPSIPDGTTDNTSYLAGLNALAISLGATLRIPKAHTGTWVIKELTLPSGTNVDAYGATFRLAGVAKRFLINTAITLPTPGSTPDTNIKWVGGTFDRQAFDSRTTLDGMNLMFGYVAGLTLEDITVLQTTANSSGAYGIYLYQNVTQFRIKNYTSNSSAVNAGSIQCTGGCRDGVIDGVYGSFGDDCVALMPRSAATYELSGVTAGGEVSNIAVRNIFVTSGQRNAVKILGGTDGGSTIYPVHDITVENVDGTYAISTSDPNVAAVWLGGGNNAGSYPFLEGGTIENIHISNVRNRRSGEAAVNFISALSMTMRGITLRNVQSIDSHCILVNTTVGGFTVENTSFDFSNAQRWGVLVNSGGNITTLRFSNCHVAGHPSTTTWAAGLVKTTNGGTVTTVLAENCSAVGYCWAIGDFATITDLFLRGVVAQDNHVRGWFNASTYGVLTVKEGAVSTASGGTDDFAVLSTAVPAIQSFAPLFRCDVSKLAVSLASATLFDDQFTGTLNTTLTAHVPDIGIAGGAWHEYTSNSNKLSGDGDVYRVSAPGPNLYNTAIPATDFQLDLVLNCKTILASDAVSLFFAAIDNLNFMFATLDQAGNITLNRKVANTDTLLGSAVVTAPIGGSSHTLSVARAGQTITVKWDGSTVITVTDHTYAGMGKVGIKVGGGSTTAQTSSTGIQADRLTFTSAQNTAAIGQQAFNTNGALGCGVGPVVWTGAVWKNLATGATT